jgi:hypothetical protein
VPSTSSPPGDAWSSVGVTETQATDTALQALATVLYCVLPAP